MTTQTAGPAQSWNLRMVSMPLRSRSSWRAHMRMNAAQPSRVSPRNRVRPISVTPGQRPATSTMTALEASHVWMPYQQMATKPRSSAGRFEPTVPKVMRASTG